MPAEATDSSNDPSLIYRGHSDYIFSLAFSPASAALASASRDTTVRVWHVNLSHMESKDITTYREHKNSLLSVAWSPDGAYIASGDTSGAIHVWNAFSGETLLIYRGHTRFARSLAWSPDGNYIVSGGDFGDSTTQ